MPAAAGTGAIASDPVPSAAVGEGAANFSYRAALQQVRAVDATAPDAREKILGILRKLPDGLPAWANPEHPVYDRAIVEVLAPNFLREHAILNLMEHVRAGHGRRKKKLSRKRNARSRRTRRDSKRTRT